VPFEAPNWTPDGNAILYNTRGTKPCEIVMLYRFVKLYRQQKNIDTGVENRENNDHVLSFDGRTVAISDKSRGGSTNYTLPAS
jgi:hypothetical protein